MKHNKASELAWQTYNEAPQETQGYYYFKALAEDALLEDTIHYAKEQEKAAAVTATNLESAFEKAKLFVDKLCSHFTMKGA